MTMSCICVVLEKQMVLRARRLIRVRKVRCVRSICAFHHNMAETAILWLNTSTAKIWLKKRQRVLKSTPTGSRTGFRSPTLRGRFTGVKGRGGSCVSSIGAGTVGRAGVAALGPRVLFRGRGGGGADAAGQA